MKLTMKNLLYENTIASTKGTVTVKANDTVHLTSADIVAKDGAVLEGSAVTLDGKYRSQPYVS